MKVEGRKREEERGNKEEIGRGNDGWKKEIDTKEPKRKEEERKKENEEKRSQKKKEVERREEGRK